MIGYKLTDADGYTRRGKSGETLWKVGAKIAPQGVYRGEPCGSGCLHFYGTPEEATLYDPIHAMFGFTARLFRIEVQNAETDGLKWWTAQSVCVIEELPLPEISAKTLIAWGICITPHRDTRDWAVGWLSGRDRTGDSARAAEISAWNTNEESDHAIARSCVAWAAFAWNSGEANGTEHAWTVATWTAKAAREVAGSKKKGRYFERISLSALDRARRILAGTLAPEMAWTEDMEG